jgi:hypothetical protein
MTLMNPSGTPDGTIASCLAAILERDDVPVPAPDHPEPWTVWRNWLATRGLGPVPIREPRRFSWPGPWLAVLADGSAAVAFGSPPGLVWAPAGAVFEDVSEGYLIAPADVALWAAPTLSAPVSGQVEALVLAGDAEAPVTVVDEAVARAGRGLVGDRYLEGRGTFSNRFARGIDLTLIDAGAIADPASARRNVITRGIDLNALVGRRFMIGEVECLGQRLCEPCAHLERLTRPGTLRALVHIGGLRADILSDGTIRAGDVVRAL